MALVLTSGPAAEPISVDEAKAHLRIDDAAEDMLISSLILTARLHVESALGLAMMTQNWMVLLDRWPRNRRVLLPLRPVQSVNEVRVLDGAGSPTVVASGNYVVDVASTQARVVANGAGWPVPGQPVNGIEIDIVAGYGASADDVPAPLRQAVLLLVAHWYEHRDPVEIGSQDVSIPAAVSRLLKPYRMARL